LRTAALFGIRFEAVFCSKNAKKNSKQKFAKKFAKKSRPWSHGREFAAARFSSLIYVLSMISFAKPVPAFPDHALEIMP